MNLLPPEDQKKIKKERFRRLFVIAGLLFAFTVASLIVLLLPSFIFLTFEKLSVRHRLAIAEKTAESRGVKEAEILLADLNQKLGILQSSRQQRHDLDEVFKNVLAKKPPNLKLNTLLYDKARKDEMSDRISLEGRAVSRDIFLRFVKALEEDPAFKRVISPLTNLLREEDFTFSLILELK